MVNLNSYWCRVIIFFLIIVFYVEKSSSQFVTVNCYECTNCTDPLVTTSSTVTITSSCNTCYKLAISNAYAPYTFIIRRCVPACLETSQSFGGGSIIATCCATNLCNKSSMKTFPLMSRGFLFIFIILHFVKHFY